MKVLSVRFRDDVKIPHLNQEKGGLSVDRVSNAGPQDPVEHDIDLDLKTGILVITSRREGVPRVVVGPGNVRWAEELTQAHEARIAELTRPPEPEPAAAPEAAPAPTAAETSAETPRAVAGRRANKAQVIAGTGVMVGGDDD